MSTIFFLLSGVCHQYASRCYSYQWQPLPLCSRCMGTFVGLALTLLLLILCQPGRRSGWPVWPVAVYGLLLFGLWLVDSVNSTMDWTVGHTFYRMSTKFERLLIGFGNGLAWGLLVAPLANGLIWGEDNPEPIVGSLWRIIPLTVVLGLAAWLIDSWRKAPYGLWLIVVTASTLGTLSLINGLLTLIVARKDGRLTRSFQLVPFLIVGLMCTLVELSMVALLRQILGV